MNTIREQACLTENAEVTLEANPTSAQTEKLRLILTVHHFSVGIAHLQLLFYRTFKTAGVTRLSVGVQVKFVLGDNNIMLIRLRHNHSRFLTRT